MGALTSDVQAVVGLIAIVAALCALVGYPRAQYRSLRDMHGRWRVLAGLPLVVMAGVVVATVLAFSEGSNLAPLLFILVAPPAWIYLLLLQFAHRRLVPNN